MSLCLCLYVHYIICILSHTLHYTYSATALHTQALSDELAHKDAALTHNALSVNMVLGYAFRYACKLGTVLAERI
jgi:demethoxyubiquinone hydroxylase (CLK1/Coq7/Cat5 family)